MVSRSPVGRKQENQKQLKYKHSFVDHNLREKRDAQTVNKYEFSPKRMFDSSSLY